MNAEESESNSFVKMEAAWALDEILENPIGKLAYLSDSESDEEIEFVDHVPSTNSSSYLGRDGSTWSKAQLKTENLQHNFLKFEIGPTDEAKTKMRPIECWQLFFTDEVIDEIVFYTNLHIAKVSENYNRSRDAKDTYGAEIKALLGLLYLSGVLHATHVNLADLWATDGTGIEYFRSSMCQNRFQFLLRCLHFENVNENEESGAISRNFVSAFMARCKKHFTVGNHTAIDKMSGGFRSRFGFGQHKDKESTVEDSLKIYFLVDTENHYTLNIDIVTGKQTYDADLNMIKRLVSPILKTGRNVTLGKKFASISLAKELLKEELTTVGTIKKTCTEIPVPLLLTERREVNSSVYCFQDDLMLLSYIPEKRKSTVLISTLHTEADIALDKAKKPKLFTFFEKTRETIEKFNKAKDAYSVSRRSVRWILSVFFTLMDIAATNSYIIYILNTGNSMSRKEYLKAISRALCEDTLKKRLAELPNLPQVKKQRICELLGTDVPGPSIPDRPVAPKRCAYCPRIKNRKTRSQCSTCSKYVCGEHSVKLCVPCKNPNYYNY